MAFRSNGPVTLALPPFRGVTRQLVLASLVVFFGLAVLGLVAPGLRVSVIDLLALTPAFWLRHAWQPLTYSFVDVSITSVLFSLLSLWMFGSQLEDDLGSRWFAEYFFAATVGGGLMACLGALLLGSHGAWLSSEARTGTMWPATMAILLAYARFYPDRPIRLMFLLELKARHLAAIYLLVYLALTLVGGDRFGAVTVVCVALAGFLYIRFTPRKGLRFVASETVFGWRNAWYRAKRRRAAKKFQVYMKKQGRDVNIDSSGRYVGLDEEKRDPGDKNWMN